MRVPLLIALVGGVIAAAGTARPHTHFLLAGLVLLGVAAGMIAERVSWIPGALADAAESHARTLGHRLAELAGWLLILIFVGGIAYWYGTTAH